MYSICIVYMSYIINYIYSTYTIEETLKGVFSRYGTVLSTKIMWPRSEEERSKGRNSGFVSFSTRRQAQDAMVSV